MSPAARQSLGANEIARLTEAVGSSLHVVYVIAGLVVRHQLAPGPGPTGEAQPDPPASGRLTSRLCPDGFHEVHNTAAPWRARLFLLFLLFFAVLCSDLSAIDISFSAEILGCGGVGDLRNREITSVLPLFFAVCDINAGSARCHPCPANSWYAMRDLIS